MEKCKKCGQMTEATKAVCKFCGAFSNDRDLARRRLEKEWERKNAEKQKKINEKNPNVLPKSTLTMTVNKEDE